jgi:hypothetical protein
MTEENTNTDDAGYVIATTPFIHRLVAFHRAVAYPGARIIKAEITDGLKNKPVLGGSAGSAPMFGVQDGLILPGLLPYEPTLNNQTLVGGATAILMSRQSLTPGVANGRFYLRGLLHESDIGFTGKGLLNFTSPAAKANLNDSIQAAVAASGIGEYFDTELVELGWRLGIAHYSNDNVLDQYNTGELIRVTPCTGFTVNRLATRQMTRGRKRS